MPLWIAPNLLTFSGFVMILVNYFLISFYDWDYTASGKYPYIVIFQNYRAASVTLLSNTGGTHLKLTLIPLTGLHLHMGGSDLTHGIINLGNFFGKK